MKWLIAALFALLLCQGFFSAWTDMQILDQQDRSNVAYGALYSRVDTLEAWLETLDSRTRADAGGLQ